MLRRTGVGSFRIENADTIEELEKMSPSRLRRRLLSVQQYAESRLVVPMKVPCSVNSFEALRQKSDLHLAIGVFDGVHSVTAVIESAVWKRSGVSVLTFDPHPANSSTE